jgi:hypothetical protein
MTQLTSVVLATLETRSFSFSAVGLTEDDAKAAIEQAWNVHRQQAGSDRACDMPAANWDDLEEAFEARLIPMKVGQGYRDFEQITV